MKSELKLALVAVTGYVINWFLAKYIDTLGVWSFVGIAAVSMFLIIYGVLWIRDFFRSLFG